LVDFRKIRSATVSQFLPFDVSPQRLHWVEIGRVPWQSLDDEPIVLLSEVGCHFPTLVRRQTVPYQNRLLSPQFAFQIIQKLDQASSVVAPVASLKE
jgi:hypothetical protein